MRIGWPEVAAEQQALWLDDYMGEPGDAALHAAAAEGRRDPRAADSLPRARQVHGAERRARLARLFEELWADRREQEISWTAPSG